MTDQAKPNDQEKEEKKRRKAEKEAADTRQRNAKAAELELKLQKAKEKSEADAGNTTGKFGTAAEPRKSMSTFLRNQNKLETSLISILDRKAAILIRICSTFVTVLIGFSQYIEANVISGGLITIILTTGLLISLILAILATKPNVLWLARRFKKTILPHYPTLEENAFALRKNCTIQEYEEAMQKVIVSQDLQLGNQIRANYQVAQNNGWRGILVDLAYSIFLLTFVVTGVVFLFNQAG